MPCFHPAHALRSTDGSVEFVGRSSRLYNLQVSCGQCIGCRLERSRQWAVRCLHEASLYDDNSFITLTYDDVHVVPTLIYWHFQDFMKRLRECRARPFRQRQLTPPVIRFFMSGEYGARFGRPHFHALLFNCDFPGRYLIRQGANPLYRSAELEQLWPFGFSSIGAVSFESAAYVARYCVPKVTGGRAAAHYALSPPYVDPETGQVFTERVPEFGHMSLRPGVGADWLRLYWSDVRDGKVFVNGRECNVPRYYARYFKNCSYGEAVKCVRQVEALARRFDNTEARLLVKEAVVTSRFKQLSRLL